MTPNVRGLLRSSDGSLNKGWFSKFRKSKLNPIVTLSVIFAFFATDMSSVNHGSPRILPRDVPVSWLIKNRLKLLKTYSGSLNRFKPAPPVDGAPEVPTPPDPETPSWIPSSAFGSRIKGELSRETVEP